MGISSRRYPSSVLGQTIAFPRPSSSIVRITHWMKLDRVMYRFGSMSTTSLSAFRTRTSPLS